MPPNHCEDIFGQVAVDHIDVPFLIVCGAGRQLFDLNEVYATVASHATDVLVEFSELNFVCLLRGRAKPVLKPGMQSSTNKIRQQIST